MYTLENATTSYNLDDYITTLESGLPKGVYSMAETIGEGGLVTGTGNIGGRIVKLSRVFTRWQESDRQSFLNLFTRPPWETWYLRRASTYFDGVIECFPVLSGGESFSVRNFNFGKEVSFELFLKQPYYTSTSASSTTVSTTSSTTKTGTVTITGAKNYCTYGFTSTAAFSVFEVKTAEGYGFKVEYSFAAGSSVTVSTTGSELIAEVDGARIDGYFTAQSKPFFLNSGSNTIYARAGVGTLTVNWYRREL